MQVIHGLGNGAIPSSIPRLKSKYLWKLFEASVAQLSQGYQSLIATAKNPSRVFALNVETYRARHDNSDRDTLSHRYRGNRTRMLKIFQLNLHAVFRV